MIPRVERLGNSFYLEDGDTRSVKILTLAELKSHIEDLEYELRIAREAYEVMLYIEEDKKD